MFRGGDMRGVFLVGAAASMWGTWSLFLRPAGVSSWVSAPVVFFLVGVLTLPLVLRDRRQIRWHGGTVRLLVLNSALDAANIVFFFGAMRYTTVAVAVLTHYLAPILVALLAPWIDRERIRGAAIAALVGAAGVALILEPWGGRAPRGDVLVGALLGGASAVCYGLNVFIARRLEPRIGAPRTVSYHAFIAAALLVPLGGAELVAIDAQAAGYLAAGALIPGALAGVMFITGLGMIGSSRAAVLAYLEPLVAVLVGWIAFAEHLGPLAILGAIFIVGGGVWVARPAADTTDA